MITRTMMTMAATAVVGWRQGGAGNDACDDAGDGGGGRGPVRVAHIRGSPAACVCVCVAAETADALLTCQTVGFYSGSCC